jgi:hypothetical protein
MNTPTKIIRFAMDGGRQADQCSPQPARTSQGAGSRSESVALGVDQESSKDDDDEAKLRQSNACEHQCSPTLNRGVYDALRHGTGVVICGARVALVVVMARSFPALSSVPISLTDGVS